MGYIFTILPIVLLKLLLTVKASNSTTIIAASSNSSSYFSQYLSISATYSSTQSVVLTSTNNNASGSTVIAVTSSTGVNVSSVIPTTSRNTTNINHDSSSFSVMPTPSSSVMMSSTVGRNPTKSRDDDEPRVSMYIWEIIACVAGALVLILLIIIAILCHKNRQLKEKLRIRGSYSLPIKENGTWIDNQDLQLWQKRASTYVQENPVAKDIEETKVT